MVVITRLAEYQMLKQQIEATDHAENADELLRLFSRWCRIKCLPYEASLYTPDCNAVTEATSYFSKTVFDIQ